MPKRMVILAVLTSLLLVASACNDDDESSVTTPKDVSCLQLGDTKCDLAGDGRAAVMVCSIIEATKNKEWVVATKCDLAECCYMETCVSVADGVLHDAPNCELGTSGDSCSNHKDCADTYFCSGYFCTAKKGSGEECDSSTECDATLACRDESCQMRYCSLDADCNQTNPCQPQECQQGECVTRTVSDGAECPGNDMCHTGACQKGVCTQSEIANCCLTIDEAVCTDFDQYGRTTLKECQSDHLWKTTSCDYPETCNAEARKCETRLDTYYCGSNYGLYHIEADGESDQKISNSECRNLCVTEGEYKHYKCLEEPALFNAACCCYDEATAPESLVDCLDTYQEKSR